MNQIDRLKALIGKKWLLVLVAMSLYCLLILAYRISWTGFTSYMFLTWNLFLAWIPLLVTATIVYTSLAQKPIILWVGIAFWLAFFPNSTYILADLLHLKATSRAPGWLDLIMILSFAWTGLMLGFRSLQMLEGYLERRYSLIISRVFSITTLFLSAFGIYIGRYLRWNTWDILVQPEYLFNSLYASVSFVGDIPDSIAMSVSYGLFLNLAYRTLKAI